MTYFQNEALSKPRPSSHGTSPGRNKLRSNSRKLRPWMTWGIALLIWGLLCWGGYALASNYITKYEQQLNLLNQQLQQIQQDNTESLAALAVQIEALEAGLNRQSGQVEVLVAQFTAVEQELTLIKEELSLAGSTISATDETKTTLSNRITELGKELDELRKLIKQLEEAARVY